MPHQPSFLSIDAVSRKVIGPTSAAFKPDSDGLSVYLDSGLRAIGLSAADVRTDLTQVVAEIAVDYAVEQGLTLCLDPVDDDPPQPAGKAHALLKDWPSGRKAIHAIAKALAGSSICSHPEGVAWDDIPTPDQPRQSR